AKLWFRWSFPRISSCCLFDQKFSFFLRNVLYKLSKTRKRDFSINSQKILSSTFRSMSVRFQHQLQPIFEKMKHLDLREKIIPDKKPLDDKIIRNIIESSYIRIKSRILS